MSGDGGFQDGLFNGGEGDGFGPRQGGDERSRLLIDAFTRLAAERGFDNVTVADVATAASLSTATFYEYFDDMPQCLAAAYDAFFDRLVDQATAACASEASWPRSIAGSISAIFEFLLETASRARLFLVEGVAGGMPLYERKQALTMRLARLLASGRGAVAEAGDLPQVMESILVGGALDRVSDHLLAEEPGALLLLEPEVVELVLTPFIGGEEARKIVRG